MDKPSSLRDKEQAKTSQERAEDIAYTINHALACMVTDYITMDPLVGATFERMTGHKMPDIGCQNPDHDHAHGDHCDHDHTPQPLWKDPTTLRWMASEFIADVACVPLTVAVQHYTPEVMHSIQKMLEPIVGPALKWRTNKEAERWGKQQGYGKDTEETKAYAEELYRHEIEHLPQAVVWTTASTLGNGVMNKALGSSADFKTLVTGKLIGVANSGGLVIGARYLSPSLAQKWDEKAAEHVYLPITKKIGKIFGIREEDVDRMAQNRLGLGVESTLESLHNGHESKRTPTKDNTV